MIVWLMPTTLSASVGVCHAGISGGRRCRQSGPCGTAGGAGGFDSPARGALRADRRPRAGRQAPPQGGLKPRWTFLPIRNRGVTGNRDRKHRESRRAFAVVWSRRTRESRQDTGPDARESGQRAARQLREISPFRRRQLCVKNWIDQQQPAAWGPCCCIGYRSRWEHPTQRTAVVPHRMNRWRWGATN